MKYFKVLIPIIISLILIGVSATCLYLNSPKSSDKEKTNFTIKSGQSTREIANNLYKKGYIRSSGWFLVYAKLKGRLIQAGIYEISPNYSTSMIYDDLTNLSPSEYSVTIPEGYRVTQIDELLAQKGIIAAGSFTQVAAADEGYLFPDTYQFLPKTDPSSIREIMKDNFTKKTAGMNLTREQVMIASIVEREAKYDSDRPKIAKVYLNRLAIGMKLEADPTVQYAKGSWASITVSDYQNVKSSYNTYLHEGLPPGPICNPGLKSFQAVLYPDNNDFLFFFTDSTGHAVFAKTKAEQDANLKSYR